MMIKKYCGWCKRLAWHNSCKSDKYFGGNDGYRCTKCGHPPGNQGPGWRYEYNIQQRAKLSGSLV